MTKQGRIFCWGSNQDKLLGLGLDGEEYKDAERALGDDDPDHPREHFF